MSYKVLLFYKYVELPEPEQFASYHLQFCRENDILGRIYVAKEGINGTVSGKPDDVEKYKKHLTSFEQFKDILFKEDDSEENAFKKIYVRVRDEIVNSGLEVNPGAGGKRLSPDDLIEFYKHNKEFIIIDARNSYESMLGKFHNAVTPDIKNFRQWRDYVSSLGNLKDKTIVTYCTGGIRCEKASAYLVDQGFKDVYQLDGGIVSFTKKYPDTFWEGGIFVFDERRVLNPNTKKEIMHTAECFFCGTPASYYINCHNIDCDRLLVSCHKCKVENQYCCSDECRKSENKRKIIHG